MQPPMQPLPPPLPGATPKPASRGLDTLKLLGAAVGVLVVALGLLVAGIFAYERMTDPRRQELQRIAIAHSVTAIEICPSIALTNCTLWYGSNTGRELVLRGFAVESFASCDGQGVNAEARCTHEAEYDSPGYYACMSRWGVVPQRAMTRGDPRDAHLPAGQMRLECAEGYREGHFSDPTF